MSKAAVTRGTSEDYGESRCHSEYRRRIKHQEAVAAVTLKDVGGNNSCMKWTLMWKRKLLISKFKKLGCACVCTYRLFLAVVFMGPDVQLQRSGSELVEGRSELEAVLEQRHSRKDVQTQSGS